VIRKYDKFIILIVYTNRASGYNRKEIKLCFSFPPFCVYMLRVEMSLLALYML